MPRSNHALLISLLVLLGGCHKTFFNDQGSYTESTPKTDLPMTPKLEPAPEEKSDVDISKPLLIIECLYETSSNVKLQLTLDPKKKVVVSATFIDTIKTTKTTTIKAVKQSTKDLLQNVEFEDGTTLIAPTRLFSQGDRSPVEKEDVLINDEDVYFCNELKN